MKRFLLALKFLTIIPVPGKLGTYSPDNVGGSLRYFPLVGALIGVILCLVAFAAGAMPGLAVAALLLAASFILTGGIHIDGFADTCDGLCSGKAKDGILKIMRDSHIGAMGTACVVIILFLKLSLIAAMPSDLLWRSLILMSIFSRWSQALSCAVSTYARKKGKAELFIANANHKDILVGGLFTLFIFFVLGGFGGIVVFSFAL
ncbi:MAG: adenosylcobinamide-GDP ribazoletransferase, partial [Candidatus Omnitrophota bacterium]